MIRECRRGGTYDGIMPFPGRCLRGLAAAALLMCAQAWPASAEARDQPIVPPELVFAAPPALEPVAAALRRLDTAKLVTTMRVLGLSEAGPPITVLLVPEDATLARDAASWVAGFANGDAGVIVLFPTRTPSYPHDSMEALLHHEVAHILISRAAPHAEIPRWFHEGLAMTLEHTWGLRDRSELALAIVGGRRSLAALDADFRGDAAAARRAYGVAGGFVRDLIRRHGLEFPARLLASLRAGATFDAAFSASAAVSLAEAERRFWHQSWWYRVVPFATSSLALWTLIVLLAVSARRRRAARRRALRERWEAEERAVAADETGLA